VWLNLITLPSPGTVTAHAPCHVTYHRGQKWSTFLKSLNPISYLLCHFYGATTNFKPCYMRKIAFSHCKGYKVNCTCAVSRDLCTGSPKTTRGNFLTHYTTFMRLQWRLRVVLYKSIPMLKRFSAAKKNQVQSKSVPKMAVFGNLRVYISNIVIETPKRHFLTRNDVFWRTLRKNPFRGVGCSLIEEPKNNKDKLVTPKAQQNHVSEEQKPLNWSIQNFACRVPSMT